jgi:hypothetical protein
MKVSSSSETSVNFHQSAREGINVCGHICETPASAVIFCFKLRPFCGNTTHDHVVNSNLMQTVEAVQASCYCVS